MKKITIPVFRYGTGADLPLPAYATEESAGMDLYAAIPGAITIPPRGREKISTGISIALPSGYMPVDPNPPSPRCVIFSFPISCH